MGIIFSVIRRKANRFNVENRAQLIISKDKPTPAPQYPSTVKQLEMISKVRGNMEEQEFGFHEPKTVPRGRCSLRQALQFINDHETDPVKWSCGNIANEYHINQDMLEKILMFYRTFHVYIPESKNSRGQILVKPPVQPTLK
uniref:NADH dehydrogenase [ubiquinone] 1 alpha subcomplex assembly factor 4 n=1 Tax=Timema tahoe TaxID=61484 RepID=A0A7R9IF11_9NEOP|nr:unnamed protein product [Timema tahoe]